MKRVLEMIVLIALTWGYIVLPSAGAEEEKTTVNNEAAELGISPSHDEFIHSAGYLRAMEHWDHLEESRRIGLTAMRDAILGVPGYTNYFEKELDFLRSTNSREPIRFTHKGSFESFSHFNTSRPPSRLIF